MDECIHGIDADWCEICNHSRGTAPESRTGSYGLHGGETKQEVLDNITDILDLPRHVVSVGSSLPSSVFQHAAAHFSLPGGTMPEICQQIIELSGKEYRPSYDSRATTSGGGSTVTLEGIQELRIALGILMLQSPGK